MANIGNEPRSAPQPERWYELKLGSSCKDRPSSKFCTLRYEFKPASIDKSQSGTLHKTKDNRVTVEFNNNQPGKPKVTFEGTSEDYKDADGVLFFDGESFRLERLHRAVKRLRHVRLPGESTGIIGIAAAGVNAPLNSESKSPPLVKTMKPHTICKSTNHTMPLEVEKIDMGNSDYSGLKRVKRTPDMLPSQISDPFSSSPYHNSHESDNNVNILYSEPSPPKSNLISFDINLPNGNDTDDEIADVDASDDDVKKGPNAAEALRAQVNAVEDGGSHQHQGHDDTSSSSGSSGSSGSGSSSSDTEDSDGDSANSVGDIDI